MKTLEMLHLRLAGNNMDELEDLIRRAVGPSATSPSVSVFRHARVQGDLLIHLSWDGPDQADQPSELGLQLASLLRIHGLVEHSVWVRREESREPA